MPNPIKTDVYIYKYKLDIWDTTLEIPRFSQPLRFGQQGDEFFLWVLINPDNPPERRRFKIFPTGHTRYDAWGTLIHIGTLLDSGNREVWHCFEEVPW